MDNNQKKDAASTSNSKNKNQRSEDADQKNGQKNQPLSKEDIPESTNESKGTTGSGQRQDSN